MKRGSKYPGGRYPEVHLWHQITKPLPIEQTETQQIAKLSQPGRPLWKFNVDFSSCPPDQIEACRFYEYCRESEEIIDLAEAFHSGKLFTGSPNDWLAKGAVGLILRFITQCPEFPKAAWLDLLPDKREAIAKSLAKQKKRKAKAPASDWPAFREMSEALDFSYNLRQLKQNELKNFDAKEFDTRIDPARLLDQIKELDLLRDPPKLLRALSLINATSDLARLLRSAKRRALQNRVSGFQSELKALESAPQLAEMHPSFHERFLVQVDLERAKSDLIKDFADWIDRKKAEFKGLFAARKNPCEKRGRAHSPKDLLRKLSAYRVHKALKWTPDKLAHHFSHIYANPEDWYRAIQECKALLQALFPSSEPPN